MEFQDSSIAGCHQILPDRFQDERGCFVKTYHCELFAARGLNTDWREEYHTVSHQRVLRGLHFQLPPHDHEKLVYCSTGCVLDAVLDLRRDAASYGRHELFTLDAARGNMLYLPRGVAHGFYVTDGPATMHYKVATVHAPAHDAGIRWDSAAIPWPDSDPIISVRDRSFQSFDLFDSPFIIASAP
jgi:dTDP-4-dehydrorhamnose 3,5-epimerase